MTDTTNYDAEARSDARQMVAEFVDTIIEQLRDNGSASDDYNNDYSGGNEYHHLTHVDRDYDLSESAAILDQLADHEETDEGLWDGLEPRRAIACQAAFTYGNAVAYYWSAIIEAINTDMASGILADMLGEDDPADDGVIKGRIQELAEETA